MQSPERIAFLIDHFHLLPHPEGGFYAPMFRSAQSFISNEGKERNLYSSIYFIITADSHSCWHRLKTDEMWHLYEGGPAVVHMIDPKGEYSTRRLQGGHTPVFQTLVPAGIWFAVTCDENTSYALFGCSLSPGFDFEDFELGRESSLLEKFPEHREILSKYSRKLD